jgi:hypothetical protein
MSTFDFNGLRFEAPGLWTDASTVTLLGEPVGPYQPNLVIAREPSSSDDLAEYASRQVDKVKGEAQIYELHQRREVICGGRNAIEVEHSFQLEGGPPVRQLLLFLAKGSLMFTASLTHRDLDFAAVRPVADALLKTLKL